MVHVKKKKNLKIKKKVKERSETDTMKRKMKRCLAKAAHGESKFKWLQRQVEREAAVRNPFLKVQL